MLESLWTVENAIALGTLTSLEIVLGIDNIVFISILSGRLPEEQQKRARFLGLMIAMVGRIVLLVSLTWIMGLTEPLFSVVSLDFTGRDLILLGGGIFLVYKATSEIHEKLEGEAAARNGEVRAVTMRSVMIQILLLDLVFSLDSVITAVGMADRIGVMISAVVVAVGVMMITAGKVSAFIEEHPTV
ncbi:MAG: TerC family protein, partial [Myxococcota bacterium]